jgi:hypothetical protein
MRAQLGFSRSSVFRFLLYSDLSMVFVPALGFSLLSGAFGTFFWLLDRYYRFTADTEGLAFIKTCGTIGGNVIADYKFYPTFLLSGLCLLCCLFLNTPCLRTATTRVTIDACCQINRLPRVRCLTLA